jgi:hypothetical protein
MKFFPSLSGAFAVLKNLNIFHGIGIVVLECSSETRDRIIQWNLANIELNKLIKYSPSAPVVTQEIKTS